MGQSQSYLSSVTNATTKKLDQDFQAAEALAFQHVKEALSDMPLCELADLEQAAFSYAAQSFNASGISVRENYLRGKASTWADWWFRKHRDERQPRPHSQYSKAQALRGRQVAAIRKRGRNDFKALGVQLARASGVKVAEVAGELNCSTRFIYKLSKRRFPKLVAVVLALALGVNVPKSSVLHLSEIQAIDLKESLPAFTIDEGKDSKRPAGEGIDGKIDDLEAIGLAIPDLLRSHWDARGL